MVQAATQSNFQDLVIVASHDRPVLVDFWASWCGPCQSLAPLLDTLADSHAGKLDIIKVDTDAESELAAQYGVRSLPTLLLFRDGQSVDQVIGAQPLSALEQFIDPWLPKASDEALNQAREAIDQRDYEIALTSLQGALAVEPNDYRIHPLLASTLIELERITEAEDVIASLPANIAVDDVYDTIKARIRMATSATNEADPADEISVAYAAAVSGASAGDYDSAVSGLLGLLPAYRDWNDGAIRTALLDIFNMLGDDPRVRQWRTKMARSLN